MKTYPKLKAGEHRAVNIKLTADVYNPLAAYCNKSQVLMATTVRNGIRPHIERLEEAALPLWVVKVVPTSTGNWRRTCTGGQIGTL